MTTSHWSDYHAKWARLRPPLRPSAEVVEGVRRLLAEHPGPALLLGVTPELAEIAPDVTAVDRSAGMIQGVWPGDTRARRAVNADWLALPFEPGTFAASVGDGSLNALRYPDGHARLHDELARVLQPGGRAVFRVFCRPEHGHREPLAAITAETAGASESFHGFKWRLAMAAAAEARSANLAVRAILTAFERAVPDRADLARRTGWDPADIDTIEVYRGSDEVYSFPTQDELLGAVPRAFVKAELVPAGTYDLAERCPLLALDRGEHRGEMGAPGG